MSITILARSEEELKPRSVTLVKEQGYGFFLQDQDGHYLNQVSERKFTALIYLTLFKYKLSFVRLEFTLQV